MCTLNKIVKLFYLFFQDEKPKEVTDDDEKRLLTFLFDKYDPELHPVLKKTDTVRVTFGISLHQIIEVVSKKYSFKELARFSFVSVTANNGAERSVAEECVYYAFTKPPAEINAKTVVFVPCCSSGIGTGF